MLVVFSVTTLTVVVVGVDSGRWLASPLNFLQFSVSSYSEIDVLFNVLAWAKAKGGDSNSS